MKQIIFLVLSLCFSQTWGITEQTKSIYNDLRNIYISDYSLFADYLEDPESIDIENKDLFLVKDMLSETYLDPQDGDFNPNRSLEKASCHFLMTAIRKTAFYMLDP